jgi:hypothetical protein
VIGVAAARKSTETGEAGPVATTDQERAAEKRRAAATAPNPDVAVQAHVDALLAERRGFVQRGDATSTALVDEQIRHYGGKPPAAEVPRG